MTDINSFYSSSDTLTATSSSSSSAIIWWLLLAIVVVAAIWFWRRWHRRRQRNEVQEARDRVFFRVTVPREQRGAEDEKHDFRELLAVFEPFLASLASTYVGGPWWGKASARQPVFTLEILAKHGEIFFYITAPSSYTELLQRQLHGQYPAAQIEISQDFKLMGSDKPALDASQLTLRRVFHFPLKTYRLLEADPLNSITNALSKLGEQASGGVQLVIRPVHTNWQKSTEQAVKKLMEGESVDKRSLTDATKSLVSDVSKAATGRGDSSEQKPKPINQLHIEAVQSKLTKQSFEVECRAVIAAATEVEARTYLNSLMSSFSQFGSPDRNALKIMHRRSTTVTRDYILRRFSNKGTMILNTEEIASLYHLPNRYIDTPNIAWLSARTLPPPTNLPAEGTPLGVSVYRGQTKPINILPDDRLRHVYMVGKTGVGKTVFFENMIAHDIASGRGVCYLDPNGDAVEWILRHIPKERAEDVIYFNPADTQRPFGLNLLEWKRPEDKDFLVQEAIAMFYKLFDPGQTGIVGPQFEHWMRNASLTLMADPNGGTLIDIPRLFVDDDFMQAKLRHVTDPVVRTFWEKQMAQTSASSKSEMLNYFTSKFGRFMTNEAMRNIIGQTKSSFDFRDVMDSGKILLVNLSKGLIGELNAQLLGMIMISKLQAAAFGRQDVPEAQRRPFFMYVDEFQNFTTDTFATILSEARKYKLALHITNQYIAQLEEKIRDAVVGNAGTLISFRIGASDAEFLTHEFDGLTVEDMVNVPKQHFYIKTLINNMPTLPFMGRSSTWEAGGNQELAAALTELSRLKFGRDVNQVVAEITAHGQIDQVVSSQ